jgi:MFS family permease
MFKGYRLLTAYVVVAYIAQGIAEHFCLPNQPINNYFVKGQNWEPTKLAAYLALLMVPWTIKPVFGAISDALPLKHGSKRMYLTFVFFLSAIGYFAAWLYPPAMTAGLLLSACGLAWGTALLLGLIIEKYPQRLIPYVFSLHFISYYSASICSGLAGGKLCQQMTPQAALSTAFAISFAVSLIAAIATPFWIAKETAQTAVQESVLRNAWFCLKDKNFWLIAAFIYCWSFTPAFGTPLYFQYTKVLMISQEQIGQANAAYSLGMLCGALIYPVIWKFFSRYQVQIAISVSIFSTLAFLLLNSSNYVLLETMRGVASMLGVLCLNWLAAGVAPKGLETFATATLIGVYNVGTQTSGIAGAFIYSHFFPGTLNPLLWLGACVIAINLVIYSGIDLRIRATDRN